MAVILALLPAVAVVLIRIFKEDKYEIDHSAF